ncbi:ATP-binding response regulator [Spirosoma jeollabukense]
MTLLDQWMAVDVFRVKQEEPYWIGVLFENITQRKKAEIQQAYLLRLSDALRPLADARQIQRTALQILGQHLQVDRVLYAEVEADEAHFVITDNYVQNNFPQMVGRFRLSDFGKTPDSQRLGQTLVLADIHQVDESDEHLRSYLAAGVVSIIGIPLRKGGRWVASLTVHHGQPRQWTAQEVALVEETAERTWAALERARAEQALRQEDKRKDEFMAMLGHELRNPLAILANTLFYLDLTQGQDETMSYAQGVAQMIRQVKQLERMVDDLLDVSRIRQGKIKIQRQPTELVGVVAQTVDAARPLYQERGRYLSWHLPQGPLLVLGDEARLAQMLMNLLTNGAKYTDEGGHVWVNLVPEGTQAVLRVTDDGVGIPPEELTAIFEVFVQGDTSLDRPHGGLGLGLAVVKQIVERHEGRIVAQSAGRGQGSTFVVQLPLFVETSSVEPSVTATSPIHPDRMQVLLVDDNQELADITAKILQILGYEVQVCYSGQEGIAVAEAMRPDVVLLDIGMPDMDGYAVCRQIRQQAWGQSLPLIAMTGFGQEADKQRSWAAGFDGHLLKPIDYTTLPAMLTKATEARNGQ